MDSWCRGGAAPLLLLLLLEGTTSASAAAVGDGYLRRLRQTIVDEVLLALDKHPVLPAQLRQLQLHLVVVGLLPRSRPRRRLPVLDHPALPPVAARRWLHGGPPAGASGRGEAKVAAGWVVAGAGGRIGLGGACPPEAGERRVRRRRAGRLRNGVGEVVLGVGGAAVGSGGWGVEVVRL